ncbi:MAG TPA: transcriptional regulator GcvA [Stellaceae bacterium]|nr:transcriptional regulator GcvA [Stellaceae bacterium]
MNPVHKYQCNALSQSIASAVPSVKRVRPPALEALRVFEAAARHASFTKAAAELHVTQGAVSQRVQGLEAELGVNLFRRLIRKLELTADGERLAQGVREGLARIACAVSELDQRSESGPLAVSMLPSFASCWLVRRLPRFQYAHPDIEVLVMADEQPVDLHAEDGAEVAIRFGLGGYPGLSTTPLAPDSVGPVCTPLLLSRYGVIETVDELLDMPLLHDSTADGDGSGTGWKSWLAQVGVRGDDPRLGAGSRFTQAHLALEAALLGQGVAMARTSLASDSLAAGRLVRVLPQIAPSAYRYFFVCRPEAAWRAKVARFRDWLRVEMKVVADQHIVGAG